MKKTRILLSCMLLLFIFSCEKDDNTIPPVIAEEPVIPIPVNFEENFGTTVTARFLGRVVDEQNMPIQGATIQIGNTVTSTDLFGIFSISDATAFEKFAYITVEKDGYIKGSRALAPSTTEVNNVEIMLLKEDVIATITSGEASNVNLPNGTEVSFDGNFIRENGAAYNGQVAVIVKHLSPDDENMEAMMPGMLFAQDASGDAVALETYGMIAVELRSSSGEELQLAEGSTSQISMPLAINTNNPPAAIPLWHFDEEVGYWIEEGEATLQGNKYVGDVSHFSFWNYDFPYPSVYICITLVDEGGRPLSYTELDIYSALLNVTGTYGTTNASGTECGWVPQGEQLTVTTATTHCANEPFTTTIGPFTTDTNITITVPSSLSATELTGTFVNCDGNNVTDGYIQLFINGTSQVLPVTDGTISYTVVYCNTLEFSLKGIDITSNQITDIITGTLDGSSTLDIGALSSCTGFVDTDEDGVFDTFEDINGDNDLTNDDTDEDGTPNYLDIDDDGDGINTADENYDDDNDPTNDDTDGDQIPDYLDALDVAIYDSEIIATGCDPFIFSITTVATQYVNTNMTYAFYETEADAIAETNALTSTYEVAATSFIAGSNIYVKGTNTITNATAVRLVYLFIENTDSDTDGLTDCEETTGVDNPSTQLIPSGITDPNDPCDPIETSSLEDSDTDGLTDCEETTGNDNPNTVSVPSGISDPNNINDPVDFTDTDGDGLTDLEETTGNNNPNTPITPSGTSDPNDPCDPIESSPLEDSDNDGLTDCEEITGIDNPNTVSVPIGTSDPNDMGDPVDLTDSDGDGLTDLEETTGNDNTATPIVPTGTSDPNDPCDPIETSSLEDNDNDGLTDCEEISGIDNLATVLVPSGISNPNDQNDPNITTSDITISVASIMVNESNGTADVVVSLNGSSSVDTVFETNTEDQTATAANDYGLWAGTATIPAGSTQITFSIQIVDDTIMESTETFNFLVSVTSDNTTNIGAEGVITIIDND